ncbi:DUF3761 domain-containing protein [Sphingomonas cannabina]|uniref:DUF3761 domain-containing protein n=1 Tax=Sphingomonas cannabina TaxID=2899123 RepID=UPI001F1D63E0|nr:DUF3761 domain-containing protein [Sphingomonas cannabina]UIJ44825.1 DUF3761 domain-containing protein [Sphingomonas cannabina]
MIARLALCIACAAVIAAPTDARRERRRQAAPHARIAKPHRPLMRTLRRPLSRVLDGSLFGGAYYRSADGHVVHRPVFEDRRPPGATARCRDGSWSFSHSRRGTCSHHGGVGTWL